MSAIVYQSVILVFIMVTAVQGLNCKSDSECHEGTCPSQPTCQTKVTTTTVATTTPTTTAANQAPKTNGTTYRRRRSVVNKDQACDANNTCNTGLECVRRCKCPSGVTTPDCKVPGSSAAAPVVIVGTMILCVMLSIL